MLRNFEIHCLAPWKAVCVKSNGLVVSDIQARETLGDLKKNNLDEILRNQKTQQLREDHLNRKFPPTCQNCQLKEASGGRSRRTFFDDVLRPLVEDRNFSTTAEPDVYFLEINTSNKCNLKCRMCNGSISTSWLNDEKKLTASGFSSDRGGKHAYTKIDEHIYNQLFFNKNNFKNLKYLALRGGEPFSEDYNFLIMQKIIDWGYAKNVVLDVSTNGTVVNEDLIAYFKQFQRVELYISLEGTEMLYEYVRGGSSFTMKDLEKNIEQLRNMVNVTLIFTVTSMVYNIGALVDIWNWFKKIRQNGDEISFSNTVVKPDYLNYQILPNELKKKFLDRILQSDLPIGVYDTGKRILRDIGTPAIVEGLQKQNYFLPQELKLLREQFKQFNTILDEARGVDLTKSAPELAEFYAQI